MGVQGWLVDFGALPPEINSGRIYSGPGSAPMFAVASAWDGLAGELHSAATSYETVIADLTSAGWHGPSSESMAAAAGPYAAWLAATAAQAERTAVQAKSAAGAYEAAFAATVPPPVIVDNRILTATLIATNILGQNTAAIAAAEAHYAQMWAQDAAAMYGYAGASAAATRLGLFASPPSTTDGEGQSAQSKAVASATGAAVAATVHSLTAGAAAPTSAGSDLTEILTTLTTLINTISGPYTPIGVAGLFKSWWQVAISIPNLGTGIQSLGPFLSPKIPTGLLTPLLASELLTTSFPHVATPTAALGRAGLIGALSVPQNWAATVPAIRSVATALDGATVGSGAALAGEAQSAMFGEAALSSVVGRGLGGSVTTAIAGPAARGAPAGARAAGRPVSRVLAGGTGRLTSEEVAEEIATTSTVIVIPPSRK